jgi:hypothetical protein
MPRDYAHYLAKNPRKKRNASKPQKKKPWLIILVLILLLVITFVRLMHHNKILNRGDRRVAHHLPSQIKTVNNEVHFDFYTIENSSATPKTTTAQYVLQVAAVTDQDDAEHLQSELALLGFDVYIDQTKSRGEILNRINIGPYFSKQAAQDDQQKLAANNIKTKLRKEK